MWHLEHGLGMFRFDCLQFDTLNSIILFITMFPSRSINKPGGHGKIVNIHYSSLGVVDSLDVRYTLGKTIDTNLDTELVKAHIELSRGRRSRKGRAFLASEYVEKEDTKTAPQEEKENDNPAKNRKVPASTTAKLKSASTKPAQHSKKKRSKGCKPRDKAPSERMPKKKRSKSNGNTTSAKSMTTAAATNDRARDGVPEFVLAKPSSPFGTLSPLGHVPKCDAPSQFPSEEHTSNATNRARACTEMKEAISKIERKTLKNVFEDQMQDAACYIDSLVGGPNSKRPAAASNDAIPATAGPRLDEE